MNEKPMSFASEMVKAILNGTKSQTRRPFVSDVPSYFDGPICENNVAKFFCNQSNEGIVFTFPFKVGDQIWVRENFYVEVFCETDTVQIYYSDHSHGPIIGYYQDAEPGGSEAVDLALEYGPNDLIHSKKMNRNFSRLTLEITNVRVERVLEISYEDVNSEGFYSVLSELNYESLKTKCDINGASVEFTAKTTGPKLDFIAFWCSIYGIESIERNEWVWVYDFKVVK